MIDNRSIKNNSGNAAQGNNNALNINNGQQIICNFYNSIPEDHPLHILKNSQRLINEAETAETFEQALIALCKFVHEYQTEPILTNHINELEKQERQDSLEVRDLEKKLLEEMDDSIEQANIYAQEALSKKDDEDESADSIRKSLEVLQSPLENSYHDPRIRADELERLLDRFMLVGISDKANREKAAQYQAVHNLIIHEPERMLSIVKDLQAHVENYKLLTPAIIKKLARCEQCLEACIKDKSFLLLPNPLCIETPDKKLMSTPLGEAHSELFVISIMMKQESQRSSHHLAFVSKFAKVNDEGRITECIFRKSYNTLYEKAEDLEYQAKLKTWYSWRQIADMNQLHRQGKLIAQEEWDSNKQLTAGYRYGQVMALRKRCANFKDPTNKPLMREMITHMKEVFAYSERKILNDLQKK